MKTFFILLGAGFVTIRVFGWSNPINPSLDKPPCVYMDSGHRELHDDYDHNWGHNDGTGHSSQSERHSWHDYDSTWGGGEGDPAHRVSGNGYDETRTADRDDNSPGPQDHYGSDNKLSFNWGPNGPGPLDYGGTQVQTTSSYDEYGSTGPSSQTTPIDSGMLPWFYAPGAHIDVNDPQDWENSWALPDGSSGYEDFHETYTHNGDVVYKLYTGKRADPELPKESLFILQSSATGCAPGYNFGRNVGGGFSNIPPTNIMILGKAQDASGSVYVLLPDDSDGIDVTPKVMNNSFYLVGAPGVQKYTMVHLTEHQALSDPDPERLELGVGEEVDLSDMPAGTLWSTDVGGISSTNGAKIKFTAPSNAPPNSATVTASIGGVQQQVDFDVVEPTGIGNAFVLTTNLLGFGSLGASMSVQLYVLPTSVSFYRLYAWEVPSPCPPTNVTGYFTSTDAWPPAAIVGGTQLGDDNCFVDKIEYVAKGAYPFPLTAGSFDYIITGLWTIPGSGVTNSFGQFTKNCSLLGENGDFSVSGFGLTVTRKLRDVYY